VANLLDQLINEIAVLSGLTTEEVTTNFTQEQLEHLLQVSQCIEEESVGPIATNLEDLSCKDDGAPSDLVNNIRQNGGDFAAQFADAQKSDFKDKEKEPPFDGSECIESVEVVNAEIKKDIDDNTEHNILLSKLYELQDNLKPLEFYYLERSRYMAVILGEFAPILKEMKRLRDEINGYTDDIETSLTTISDNKISGIIQNQTTHDNATDEIARLTGLIADAEILFNDQETLRSGTEQNYPLMTNGIINGYADGNNGIAEKAALIVEVKSVISNSIINSIEDGLDDYSEYITIDISSPSGSYSNILQNPIVGFKLQFQDLISMQLDKEHFDIESGDKFVYKETYLIKDNPLLLKNTFFQSGPGYIISHIAGNEDADSKGALYTKYYNLLNDPTNNFFSLEERGLTSSIGLLDPKLVGQDAITKKEKETDYFIQNMDAMANFYKNFDTTWEARQKQVRAKIVSENLSVSKNSLELVARHDVQLLLSLGRVNIYSGSDGYSVTADDGTTSTVGIGMLEGAQTAITAVSNANNVFAERLLDLQEEITRIETIKKETKPTPEKIKARLKEENSKCFDDIPDDLEGEAACSDVKSVLGSDPFFESLDGIDPNLPNFSQGCYWREFAKLATIQGLFPMVNSVNEFRYWPVGLVIPSPSGLIKIPLPQIWIPLITISTPLGILVIFLNINGIFISPVVFFMSSSGYKQHLVTIRGSSEKFGSDKEDELIKPLIQIPLAAQSAIDKAQAGSLKPEDNYTEEEAAKVSILKGKEADAKEAGDTVREYKAKKEAVDMATQAVDRVKPETTKMAEAADKGEEVGEMVEDVKKKVFKTMDDLGKPALGKIDKLKAKAAERSASLRAEKKTAMASNDKARVKEINKELKSDGLDLEEKKSAYIEDLLNYFDNITFPKIVLPKETDKIDPKPESTDESKDKATEMSSSHDKEFVSDQLATVKNMIAVAIAKHKKDLEEAIPSGTYNVNDDLDKVKGFMKDMVDSIKDKAKGAGSNPVDPASATKQLKEADDNRKEQTNPEDKEASEKRYEGVQESLSKKMESARTKQTLSITPGIISALSGVSISFDPFAKCCPSDTFSIGFPLPPDVNIAVNGGSSLVKGVIDGMSAGSLKSVFGGKNNVNAKDIRLGVLGISKSAIPDSMSIPKPELNLSSATEMFSGILGGMSMPQASFPTALSLSQLNAKINVDLSIVKEPIKNALSTYLQNNLEAKNAQSLETDFIYTSPNDIKAFMKKFIESMTGEIEGKLTSYYDIINAAGIKNANGMDLNVLEAAVFNVPPFGTIAKTKFIVKGKLKFAKTKSESQWIISEDALKIASGLLKTALTPIVSNPVAGLLVAGAGAVDQIDIIRKIHPILSADDIPPWERLTMKNVLFLIFLDQFCSVGADQVGFFRQYL
jgi:hypothetical protein